MPKIKKNDAIEEAAIETSPEAAIAPAPADSPIVKGGNEARPEAGPRAMTLSCEAFAGRHSQAFKAWLRANNGPAPRARLTRSAWTALFNQFKSTPVGGTGRK